ncbi:MAG TPA: VOC family protein [Actinoplanes sp.]|jgi:catechol 2,3-dioxygenase-like lactoylglutathione lyase family enzyme|nr:VOC family protein [Actinoplanes sp.]
MEAHVSSILLGVQDMDRSKRFYTEGLGWKVHWALSSFSPAPTSAGGSCSTTSGRHRLGLTSDRVRSLR